MLFSSSSFEKLLKIAEETFGDDTFLLNAVST